MDTKYCTLSDEQLDDTIKRLHSRVHIVLTYKESGYEELEEYFDKLLTYIGAVNELFGKPAVLSQLMIRIQVARIESQNDNFKAFRKAILDSHDLINKLRG